jgi:hypothetical protein
MTRLRIRSRPSNNGNRHSMPFPFFCEIKNTHQDNIGALKHKKENISAKKTEFSTGFLGRLLVKVHRRDAKDVEVRVISGSLFLSALV